MNSSNVQVEKPRAEDVVLNDDTLMVELTDGRTISAPLAWYPRLLHANRAERCNWRLVGAGEGIHWPDLDEDLSVESLILGNPSGESGESFKRWLESHKKSASAGTGTRKSRLRRSQIGRRQLMKKSSTL